MAATKQCRGCGIAILKSSVTKDQWRGSWCATCWPIVTGIMERIKGSKDLKVADDDKARLLALIEQQGEMASGGPFRPAWLKFKQ